MVQALLNAGADVHAKGCRGYTALHMSAEKGRIETVQALLYAGANVGAKTNHGNSALIIAAREGHTKIVQVLLTNGANINAKGYQRIFSSSCSVL